MAKENLNIEQNLQTVQRLSPRQVQFVRLLEMSGPELEEEVLRQLDDNPALEKIDSLDNVNPDEGSEIIEDPLNRDPDDDPADYLNPSSNTGADTYLAPQIADESPTLYDYLIHQLGEYEMPDDKRQLATYIIGNIDENGYLTRSLSAMADDISVASGIEITTKEIKEVFDIIRTFDPAGIGAVDLRDCLLLQLNRMEAETLEVKAAREIVSDYFDLLSKKHLDRLQAQVGIKSKHEMQATIDLIRTLNPKPGSSIAPSQTLMRMSQISPDVMVESLDDGRFNVSLVSNLPQLQIEKSFAVDDMPKAKENTSLAAMQQQASAFIKLKRDDAEAFIGALQQRSNTLISVTEAIVRHQADFFATGDRSKLRPMILKDVAALTGLDLSVISRATSGKYVTTNNGIYPLKMFFNEAPKDNSDTSAHQIMHKLQEIIDKEDKRHPMSDEALKDEMQRQGYDLARRTVTKYRERLGLPIGRLRKGI